MIFNLSWGYLFLYFSHILNKYFLNYSKDIWLSPSWSKLSNISYIYLLSANFNKLFNSFLLIYPVLSLSTYSNAYFKAYYAYSSLFLAITVINSLKSIFPELFLSTFATIYIIRAYLYYGYFYLKNYINYWVSINPLLSLSIYENIFPN